MKKNHRGGRSCSLYGDMEGWIRYTVYNDLVIDGGRGPDGSATGTTWDQVLRKEVGEIWWTGKSGASWRKLKEWYHRGLLEISEDTWNWVMDVVFETLRRRWYLCWHLWREGSRCSGEESCRVADQGSLLAREVIVTDIKCSILWCSGMWGGDVWSPSVLQS